mmetsp:Transcript_43186/g.101258  ORF Transcript_43186/g.101258 Transcript_43186/m.101258 type:complete len:219 (+) Transcript_43186:198-854(+)
MVERGTDGTSAPVSSCQWAARTSGPAVSPGSQGTSTKAAVATSPPPSSEVVTASSAHRHLRCPRGVLVRAPWGKRTVGLRPGRPARASSPPPRRSGEASPRSDRTHHAAVAATTPSGTSPAGSSRRRRVRRRRRRGTSTGTSTRSEISCTVENGRAGASSSAAGEDSRPRASSKPSKMPSTQGRGESRVLRRRPVKDPAAGGTAALSSPPPPSAASIR